LRRRLVPAIGVCVMMAVYGRPPGSAAQSLVDLVNRITPSVAFVLATRADGKPQDSGSAFVIGPVTLLTALHVVQAASRISVQLPGRPAADADVVGIDIAHDVAVLNARDMQGPGPVPLSLGRSSTVQLGEAVAVVGYPLASPEQPTVTVTQGIVSAIRTAPAAIQIDAAINPGDSGGPVVAPDGRVIGIADASVRGAQNVNFAVPIDAAGVVITRAASASPLPLPLTAPAQLVLAHTGNDIGPHEHEEKEGAVCLPPPAHAAALTAVSVEMRVQPPLHMAAWLSWEQGLPLDSPGIFGQIDDSVSPQLAAPITNLDLPPKTVCLNYLAWNNTLTRAGRTFAVAYTLEFRVFTVPSTVPASP
jgi:hypothetical protein